MQTILLGLGIGLALVSLWWHRRLLKRVQSANGWRLSRHQIMCHSFLYLGLAYAAIAVSQPAWTNQRVVWLLLLVDLLSGVVALRIQRRRQLSGDQQLWWRRQTQYLLLSQLLLAIVLAGILAELAG
ncbi:hypothetical protein [Levilactobacillus lindianensis]|uniref:hypothetical protein n=1 Tax=Levilactobacillus lindianensis TaxID=2486018 RepID=UPI000F7357BA|nr:hypothetical protein [Levilactobacillus lindianensis]